MSIMPSLISTGSIGLSSATQLAGGLAIHFFAAYKLNQVISEVVNKALVVGTIGFAYFLGSKGLENRCVSSPESISCKLLDSANAVLLLASVGFTIKMMWDANRKVEKAGGWVLLSFPAKAAQATKEALGDTTDRFQTRFGKQPEPKKSGWF